MSPDQSAGGGIVIDTQPPKLRKGTYHYFEKLSELRRPVERSVLIPLMRSYKKTSRELSKETGFTEKEICKLLKPYVENGKVKVVAEDTYAACERLEEAKEKAITSLNEMQKENTYIPPMSIVELYTRTSPPYPFEIFQLIIPELISEGYLEQLERKFKLKCMRLSRKQERLREILLRKLSNSPPLRESELLSVEGFDERSLRNALDLLIREGLIVRFKDGAYVGKEEYEKALRLLIDYLKNNHEINVIEAKQLFGWCRRATISFLEHLDRQGITVRNENKRFLSKTFSLLKL